MSANVALPAANVYTTPFITADPAEIAIVVALVYVTYSPFF